MPHATAKAVVFCFFFIRKLFKTLKETFASGFGEADNPITILRAAVELLNMHPRKCNNIAAPTET